MSLLAYLNTKDEAPQGFVTGNEACDADSFVTAFVTACALTQSTGRLYTPIAQCTREEFDAMKREIFVLLEICQAPIQDILGRFLFVPVGDPRWAEGRLRPLILTDHNEPTDGRVKICDIEFAIDHHDVISDQPLPYPHVIERVGSCSSLVAREYWKLLDKISMHMLLAVVLLDTSNLTEKTKSLDLEIAGKLKEQLEISEETCRDIYRKLHKARTDPEFWVSLAPQFQLKMDMKNFKSFAASTVRLALDEISGTAMETAMIDYARELNVKIFLLLTAHKGGREVTAYAETAEIMEHLAKTIADSGYSLGEIASIGARVRTWSFVKHATRKEVAPTVARCAAQIKHLLEK